MPAPLLPAALDGGRPGAVGSDGGPRPADSRCRRPAPGSRAHRFRDQAGRVLYVGRAVSLRRRVLSYGGDLGDRAHLAPMVARIARVEAVICGSAHEAAWLERNLLRPASRRGTAPRRPGGGGLDQAQRVPASPAADRRAPACLPATSVPYLGGQKVRDAVSGLGRVLPLGYAADGRRVPNATWPGCAAPHPGPGRAGPGITAVLDRDQAAVASVRAELTARRDAAAAALAFEFAGRLPGRTRGARLGDRGAEGHPGPGRRRRVRLGGRCARLFRDPRRPDARLAAAALRGRRRPPLAGTILTDWAAFALRNGGLAARWSARLNWRLGQALLSQELVLAEAEPVA